MLYGFAMFTGFSKDVEIRGVQHIVLVVPLHNFGLKKNFISSKAKPIRNFQDSVLKYFANVMN